MSDGADGYLNDIGFVPTYFRDLSPARMRLAILKAGFPAPRIEKACELGFGQGLSLAIHAAASSIEWHGNDINAAHVASARDLLTASGASAHLCHESFAQFAARTDLPDFDYVALAGVWSWISPQNRKVVVDFLRKRLKVGGICYVSYNALPGWAPHMALRDLLVAHAGLSDERSAPILDRVKNAVNFAGRLLNTAPAFARDNPQVAERMARLGGEDLRGVAHEYFNRDLCPMHFSTTASLLAEAALSHAGSAYIGDLDAIYLTESQKALLDSIEDPAFRMDARDYIANAMFRRDYWIKGPIAPLTGSQRADQLRRTRVIATRPAPALPTKLRAVLALRRVGPPESVYRPILAMLTRFVPMSLGEIESELRPEGATLEQILEAVLLMAAERQLEPVPDREITGADHQAPRKLNRHLLEKLRCGEEIGYLASLVTGGGVHVGRLQQSCLLALGEGVKEPDGWAEFASKLPPPKSFAVSSSRTDPAQFVERAQLKEQAAAFARDELPLLEALGIA
jgi:hypothetical protein